MKKLLIELRDFIEDNGMTESGLCDIVYSMNTMMLFTSEEAIELLEYIHTHRPKKGKHFNKKCQHSSNGFWFWPEYDIKSRLSWLKDKIKRPY